MRHRVRDSLAVFTASLVASAVPRPARARLQDLQPPLGVEARRAGVPPLAAQRAERVVALRALRAVVAVLVLEHGVLAPRAVRQVGHRVQPALEAQLLVALEEGPYVRFALRRVSVQKRVTHGARRERGAAQRLGAPQRAHGALRDVHDAHAVHAVFTKRVVALFCFGVGDQTTSFRNARRRRGRRRKRRRRKRRRTPVAAAHLFTRDVLREAHAAEVRRARVPPRARQSVPAKHADERLVRRARRGNAAGEKRSVGVGVVVVARFVSFNASRPPVARVEAQLARRAFSPFVALPRERLAQRAFPQVLHPLEHDGLARASLVPDAPQIKRAPLERAARREERAQRERRRVGGGVRFGKNDAEAHGGQGRDEADGQVMPLIGDEHDAGHRPVRVRAVGVVVGLDVQVETQETVSSRLGDFGGSVAVVVVAVAVASLERARGASRFRGRGAAQVIPEDGRQGGELIELRCAVVVERVGVGDVVVAAVRLVAVDVTEARQLRHERALQFVLPRRLHAFRNRAHRVFFSFDTRAGRARSITPPSSASTSATRHAPAYAGIRMA
mmetsp:Transcript_1793/g.7410  ORF Transcript_1793/g.7410 Transcript_1793/m.7410 type:complete len:559 (+) Transcript_1793:521-2197(+)